MDALQSHEIPIERRVGGNFARRDRTRRGGVPQKWFLTAEAREVLLSRYDTNNRRAIARTLGVPPHVVSKWAGQLGIRRTKEKPWTAADEEFLRTFVAHWGWDRLAKHLGRSRIAVQLKAKRLGYRKTKVDGYTVHRLARLLGEDDHKVRRWIETKQLAATRRNTDRTAAQGGDAFLITDAALRSFLRSHPTQVDLRRVDREWFLALAFGESA